MATNKKKLLRHKRRKQAEKLIRQGKRRMARFMGYTEGYVDIFDNNAYPEWLVNSQLPQFKGTDHGEWCDTHPFPLNATDTKFWVLSTDRLEFDTNWNWLISVIHKMRDTEGLGYKLRYQDFATLPIDKAFKLVDTYLIELS